jgi:hypothetical protein
MSVLRLIPNVRQTAAFVAPPSSAATILGGFLRAVARSVPGPSAYATKMRVSLVLAAVLDEASC